MSVFQCVFMSACFRVRASMHADARPFTGAYVNVLRLESMHMCVRLRVNLEDLKNGTILHFRLSNFVDNHPQFDRVTKNE